jgi:hypothetical protein
MAIQLQLRKGTKAQNDAFVGAEGELTYDTQTKELRVHDGITQGGNKVVNILDIIDAVFPDYSRKVIMTTPFTAPSNGYALWNNNGSTVPQINGEDVAGVAGNDSYNEGPAMLFLRTGDVLVFSSDYTQGGAAFYPCKGN